MCGIAGQVHKDEQRTVDRAALVRMSDVIRHRGPDSGGFYTGGPVGLAARRLSVIDLETGDQPLSNEDGSIRLVFNGEIYNFRELRVELQEKGHRFRTSGDTETIVHLYEEYGVEGINRLRGMFAFALWDEPNRRLLLARDRLGKKPLYYAEHEGSLVFGSEIKCLLQCPGFPRQADPVAIHHYLSLQYVPDPLCAFAGVSKLPASHWLLWEKGRIRIEQYWELSYEPKHRGTLPDLERELVDRLDEAVRIRLVSDVPLGVHLSGGIDSSIVAALAARRSDRPVKSFSMGFEEEHFDELPYARLVAEAYGTDHHEFRVGFGEIPTLVEKLARCFDEPFADPSAIPVFLLAEETRKHVTVALNGDGGDEIFAGYIRYGLDRAADVYGRMPRMLTQTLAPAVLNLLPQPMDRPGEGNWIAGAKRMAQASVLDPRVNFLRWGSYFNEEMKQGLWKNGLDASGRELPATPDWFAEIHDRAPAGSRLDRTLALDTATYLSGDLLVKADRMTMAHSLEARSPFLDHEFQAWAARLPSDLKLRGRTHKYILKRACSGILPPGILNRGKQGFGIPLGAWLQGPLRHWMEGRLLRPEARLLAFFNEVAIHRLVLEHAAGKTSHANRLWALLMLDVWLEEYL